MAEPTTKTVSLNAQPDLTRRHRFMEVAIQFTDAGAPTYTTGGETIDLSTITNPGKHPRSGFPAGTIPSNDDIEVLQVPAGHSAYLIQNGTLPTLKNFLLKIYTTAATEHASGALAASLFGATVGASPKFIFRIRFKNWR